MSHYNQKRQLHETNPAIRIIYGRVFVYILRD